MTLAPSDFSHALQPATSTTHFCAYIAPYHNILHANVLIPSLKSPIGVSNDNVMALDRLCGAFAAALDFFHQELYSKVEEEPKPPPQARKNLPVSPVIAVSTTPAANDVSLAPSTARMTSSTALAHAQLSFSPIIAVSTTPISSDASLAPSTARMTDSIGLARTQAAKNKAERELRILTKKLDFAEVNLWKSKEWRVSLEQKLSQTESKLENAEVNLSNSRERNIALEQKLSQAESKLETASTEAPDYGAFARKHQSEIQREVNEALIRQKVFFDAQMKGVRGELSQAKREKVRLTDIEKERGQQLEELRELRSQKVTSDAKIQKLQADLTRAKKGEVHLAELEKERERHLQDLELSKASERGLSVQLADLKSRLEERVSKADHDSALRSLAEERKEHLAATAALETRIDSIMEVAKQTEPPRDYTEAEIQTVALPETGGPPARPLVPEVPQQRAFGQQIDFEFSWQASASQPQPSESGQPDDNGLNATKMDISQSTSSAHFNDTQVVDVDQPVDNGLDATNMEFLQSTSSALFNDTQVMDVDQPVDNGLTATDVNFTQPTFDALVEPLQQQSTDIGQPVDEDFNFTDIEFTDCGWSIADTWDADDTGPGNAFLYQQNQDDYENLYYNEQATNSPHDVSAFDSAPTETVTTTPTAGQATVNADVTTTGLTLPNDGYENGFDDHGELICYWTGDVSDNPCDPATFDRASSHSGPQEQHADQEHDETHGSPNAAADMANVFGNGDSTVGLESLQPSKCKDCSKVLEEHELREEFCDKCRDKWTERLQQLLNDHSNEDDGNGYDDRDDYNGNDEAHEYDEDNGDDGFGNDDLLQFVKDQSDGDDDDDYNDRDDYNDHANMTAYPDVPTSPTYPPPGCGATGSNVIPRTDTYTPPSSRPCESTNHNSVDRESVSGTARDEVDEIDEEDRCETTGCPNRKRGGDLKYWHLCNKCADDFIDNEEVSDVDEDDAKIEKVKQAITHVAQEDDEFTIKYNKKLIPQARRCPTHRTGLTKQERFDGFCTRCKAEFLMDDRGLKNLQANLFSRMLVRAEKRFGISPHYIRRWCFKNPDEVRALLGVDA